MSYNIDIDIGYNIDIDIDIAIDIDIDIGIDIDIDIAIAIDTDIDIARSGFRLPASGPVWSGRRKICQKSSYVDSFCYVNLSWVL